MKPISNAYNHLEREYQTALFNNPTSKSEIWGEGACNFGEYNYWDRYHKKITCTKKFDFVLKHEDGILNLYPEIRESALEYFKRYNIEWWREGEDFYYPTGHLMSSQNHCLNHLFAMREDDVSVLKMINSIQSKISFVKVLSCPIDDKDLKSFISFEFAHKNHELLDESEYGKRGSKCTSVDAMVYAEDVDGKRWLIPIEWKYSEYYDPLKRGCEKSLPKYKARTGNGSNLPAWTPVYEYDPGYEFARQELFMEALISAGLENVGFQVDDFLHVIVIPKEHTELRDFTINEFKPSLRNTEKLLIKSPEEMLAAPMNDNRYHKLKRYLEIRYWNR